MHGILYFAGSMVRVPEAVRIATLMSPHAPFITGVSREHPEIVRIASAIGHTRVYTTTRIAKDTVGEVVDTASLVRQLGITELFLVTEPGQLDRAWRIARIIHPKLTLVPCATSSSGYLSPWSRTTKDIVRAWWATVRGRA